MAFAGFKKQINKANQVSLSISLAVCTMSVCSFEMGHGHGKTGDEKGEVKVSLGMAKAGCGWRRK